MLSGQTGTLTNFVPSEIIITSTFCWEQATSFSYGYLIVARVPFESDPYPSFSEQRVLENPVPGPLSLAAIAAKPPFEDVDGSAFNQPDDFIDFVDEGAGEGECQMDLVWTMSEGPAILLNLYR